MQRLVGVSKLTHLRNWIKSTPSRVVWWCEKEVGVSDDKVLTKEIAEQFVKNPQLGSDRMHTFSAVTDDAAAVLEAYPLHLRLGGVVRLSVAAASCLARHKGDLNAWKQFGVIGREDYLNLGIYETEDAVVEALSHFEGLLQLGLEELSQRSAVALGKHVGGLDLGYLREIDDDCVDSISRVQGRLRLGVYELSDNALQSLSLHKGQLRLDSLEELSDVGAEHLAEHQGELGLLGLTGLSEKAAEGLSHHRHPLYIGQLDRFAREISDGAVRSLCKHPDLHVSGKFERKIKGKKFGYQRGA